MHNPNISQRRRQIMLLLSYVLMTVAVLVISVVCLMLILGYRFDANNNRFVQGGLIQFRTTPTSANITLNDRRLNFTTPGKMNVAAGEHTVEYTKDGYLPWRKTVDIMAGELRWLNYARLIPEEIGTEAVLDLNGFSDSLISPDRSFIAVLQDDSSSAITMIDIRDEQRIAQRPIEPKEDVVSTKKSKFSLVEWDSSSRYVIVEQTIGKEKQFLRVDRVDTDAPVVNISETVQLALSEAHFYRGSNTQILAKTGDSLRVINLSNQTISSPIITGVSEFSLVAEDEIAFVANRDERLVVGVYVGDKEVLVRTFDDSGSIAAGMGTYYDERYLAVAHNNKLELVLSPESDEGSAGRNFVELELPFTPESVSFSPTGRFVMAVQGMNVYIYDLEIENEFKFTYPGQAGATGDNISWIDSYYLASTQDAAAVIGEFDGHNRHRIVSAIKGSQASFNDDGDYLYSFVKNGDVFQLQRSALVID